MDIRSFFAPKGGTKSQVKNNSANNLDNKKRANVISDSDSDDDFEKKSKVIKKVSPTPKKTDKGKDSNSKLKEVNAKDFFGSSSPAIKKELPKPKLKEVNSVDFFANSPANNPSSAVKRKSLDKDTVRDSAFEATVKETTFSPKNKKPRTDSPEASSRSLSSKLSKSAGDAKTTPVTTTPKKANNKLVTSPTPNGNLDKSSLMDTSLNDSSIPGTPQEEWEAKKAAKTAAYRKYVSRGGAKNPGSKEIPSGSPNCLEGLVFVLTGIYESLEREEMTDIIKRLGGKVTTSLSKNTKYLVVGEEAGESKLAKAKTLGTVQLNEDEFLNLIKEKTVKEKENKTPDISPVKDEEKLKIHIKEKSEEKFNTSTNKLDKLGVSNMAKIEVKTSNMYSPKLERKAAVPKVKSEEVKPSSVPSQAIFSEGQVDLWVDKCKPANCKGIIGQQGDRSNMNKLKIWLRDWNKNHLNLDGKKPAPKPAPWGAANDNGAWAKCALLSGPPGVGKTTTAYLVCKELGYDVVEMNASDTRSKKMLGESVSDTLNTTSVASMMGKGNENNSVTKKRVLLMDEVDGMAGNEDRGGIAELIVLLKSSKVPVICMCNDRNHQKIRSLANYCFDLRFSRPRVEQIKAAMMSICFKEKIQIKPEALNELIIGCGQDVRQVLHHLSMVKASGGGEDGGKMDAAQAKKEAEMSKKTSVKMGPWDVCKKVFSEEDHRTMSFYDKSDLYFYDYNLAGLFVQENYLQSKPVAAKNDKKKLMSLVSKAADSIAQGDLVEKGIRSGMNWGLLPTAAVFCSVVPGEHMSGFLTGQVQFPSWLGKNSKKNKIDRILQELQVHTRLSAGVSKGSLALDYGQVLRNHIISPLVKEGANGVDMAVSNMGDYSLLREDLDGLLEVTQWPDKPDPLRAVDSKTKASFTRKYNKDGAALPYSIATTVSKRKGGGAGSEDMLPGDEEEDYHEEEEDDDKIEKDASIKVKKAKTTAKDDSGAKGKSKSSGSKGKGKK